MKVNLYPYQQEAVGKMHNGCILCGGVGSGKSMTSLAYYTKTAPRKRLYIITTARKRDSGEWWKDIAPFDCIDVKRVVIDSWNNIQKYKDVTGEFFIFDEQRVVGYGKWSKTFIKIAHKNLWILLSATPGDTWGDYIPVFIANGFYRNKTEFEREHIVWKRFAKFPMVDRYVGLDRLVRLRDRILVNMDFERPTTAHHEDIICGYDILEYRQITRNRWNIWTNEPIVNAAEYCQCLRRVVNTSESRILAVLELFEKHPKVIIFYNYDYELEMLKGIYYGTDVEIAEWNGHKHQPVPEGKSWVYLVQYNAGAEAWNCITTDTIIFYSANYSYKIMIQASGRIDRLNTPFINLYYYHLKSKAPIDKAIDRALDGKKKFNESGFTKRMFGTRK